MVSTTTEVPSATVFSAISCACMSVAKPGYSCVRKPTALGRADMAPRIQSGPVSMVRPASTSLSSVAPGMPGSVSRSVMSPPAAPTAHRKVPASMRSEMTRCSAPCRRSTPSITMRSVPWPWMRAPILMSSSARSMISARARRFQDGPAIRQHCRHEQVLGAGHGDHVGADGSALQALGARHHEAVLDADLGAQRGQALDVLIHRTLADGAAAGQADARLAEPGHQGT